MGINFPAAPIIGELYPTPAIAGIPQYKWDGTVWLAMTPSALTYVQRGGDTMTGHLALPTSPAAANAVRRDFVEAYAAPFDALAYSGMQINGSIDVSQEAGNYSFVGSQAKRVADGWLVSVNLTGSGQVLVTQQPLNAEVPGFKNCLQAAPSTAQASLSGAEFVRFQQRIEGYRIARLGWGTSSAKPITVSFWARASVSGTYRLLVQNFDSSVITAWVPFVITGGATFQFVTVTVPAQTTGVWKADNLVGLELVIETASSATANTIASGGYFSITGVVVLPGSQAPTAAQSPMIMRPYDQELQTCLRYYEKLAIGTNNNRIISSFPDAGQVGVATWLFKVQKRAVPTIAVVNGSVGQTVETTSVDHHAVSMSNGYAVIGGGSSADARL